MHLLPILSTLRRHRLAATLIVLEIALTCAIVCNALFLIDDRLSRMDRASGVVEDEIVRVHIAGIGRDRKPAEAQAITEQDLASLRAIPGVVTVATTNMIPFGNSSWNNSASTVLDDPKPPVNVATFMGTADLAKTFGVTFVAGRDFAPDDFVTWEAVSTGQAIAPTTIITRGLADKLFPDGNAIGKQLYTGKDVHTIIGVIDHLARPNGSGGPEARYAMLLPVAMPYNIANNYILRVDPARKDEVLAAVDPALDKVDPSRVVLARQTFADIREKFFVQDRAMAWLLAGVSLALLVITALGVIGLASFWVQQRTRQIGIRRALGATRGDILRYFQLENFILATLGIVLGMVLAYGMNLMLMETYKVPRLPAEVLPIGAALLWALGQVAVLGPALRASLIPPAVATRSV